jgi:hypothetical protein
MIARRPPDAERSDREVEDRQDRRRVEADRLAEGPPQDAVREQRNDAQNPPDDDDAERRWRLFKWRLAFIFGA